MLCHCPAEVDDYTDTLLMQLAAFLKSENGIRFPDLFATHTHTHTV